MSSATTPLPQTKRMPVIGIVGGIGSGKSAVARWVAEHANVIVLNADELGHDALRDGGVKAALSQRFGDTIFGPDGEVVRSALAARVFGPTTEHQSARRDLEQIVHPEIGRRISAGIDVAVRENRAAVLVDAAVLLEAGWRDKCDLVVYVETDDAIRLARVQQNRGWNQPELQRRESSQWTAAQKRQQADLIVSNDTELESAGQQLLMALRQYGLTNLDS